MTVKTFLEALKDNAAIIVRESDNAVVAEFNRDSYKAISDTYLLREVDDIEVAAKSAITITITSKEQSNTTDGGNTPDPNDP